MKRPRLDVNLGELDQLLDQATSAPISAADSGKIKTALHAMAELIAARRRTTEKASAVVPPVGGADPARPAPDQHKPPRPGHGRTPASDYISAQREPVAHPKLQHAGPCPECPKSKVHTQKEPKH